MNIPFSPVGRDPLRLALLLLCAAVVGMARADDGVIPRERHPWAAFRPGSWKLVKVTTETFDKDGKSLGESVTETRTMLLSVDATSYELQVDVTVDVAGKRFPSQPRLTRQGFHGESEGQRPTIRGMGPVSLKIGDRALTAQSAEIETTDKDSRRVTQLRYGAGIQPYVLSRRSLIFGADGKMQQETDVLTLAVQVPRTVLGVRRNTWETRTTQKQPAGVSVVTDEIHCFDIPGGVIEHTSQEKDEKDVVRRRSKLELVNYGIATEKPLRRRHGQPRRSKR